MGMKEYIEQVCDSKEDAEKVVKSWEDYPIYNFEIVPFEGRWKLIMRLIAPMMG